MIKATKFKNAKLRYKDEGSGKPIVLLHGYLESLEIWDDFSAELAKKYRVISIDFPGHGDSGIVAAIHTMDIMAEAVVEVLDEWGIDKCFLIGHSMGGYVTMAFVSNYRNRLFGYCLFHSTPFADAEEKRKNRDREIELVRAGKKDYIVSTNIPKAFANDNVKKFPKELEKAQAIARTCYDEGIITVLNGMKIRPDRRSVMQNANVPALWICGQKDNYIPYDIIVTRFELLNKKGKKHILKNSGHMGFMEEKEESLKVITEFIEAN